MKYPELMKVILSMNTEKEVASLIESYVSEVKNELYKLKSYEAKRECISGYNRMFRKDHISHGDMDVQVGDICFIDFGQAYLNEAGFQHFGLVLTIFNYKAYVIPMSSNTRTISKAFNYPDAKEIRSHLYYIGQVAGLHKPSVLFLNDGKFINTSRIISINAKIDVDSEMFKEISAFTKSAFSI